MQRRAITRSAFYRKPELPAKRNSSAGSSRPPCPACRPAPEFSKNKCVFLPGVKGSIDDKPGKTSNRSPAGRQRRNLETGRKIKLATQPPRRAAAKVQGKQCYRATDGGENLGGN